jgi:hypothetical protein
MGIRCRIFAYDWSRREDDKRRITAGLKAGLPIVSPDNHRLICDSEAENLVATQLRAKRFPPSTKPLWQGERYRHDKIRIAYKSTDFRVHPVAALIVGCFGTTTRRVSNHRYHCIPAMEARCASGSKRRSTISSTSRP